MVSRDLFEAGNFPFPIRDELRSFEIPGCVRVTTGTREQIRRFLSELEAIW